MRTTFLRLHGAILLFLFVDAAARAQTAELQVLRVELNGEAGNVLAGYELELRDFRSHQKVDTAELSSDGSFTLRRIPYGDYQLVIVDRGGNPVHQEFLNIGGMVPLLTVQLKGEAQQRPPSGPVSVSQLQHLPDRKAMRAVQAAQRFSEQGDFQKAEQQLRKAVQISPYYADAYTNLAVQHIRMGRYEEAGRELRRAIEIGGPNPLVLTNLASTEYALKRGDEAAQYARAALRLQPDYPQAHFILGLALCVNARTAAEGLEHLRKAAFSMPQAKQQIARVEQALR